MWTVRRALTTIVTVILKISDAIEPSKGGIVKKNK
jgi:hypothetical protein